MIRVFQHYVSLINLFRKCLYDPSVFLKDVYRITFEHNIKTFKIF